MQDIDVTNMTEKDLEDIIRVHSPTSHLRTKAQDELNRRHRLAEAKMGDKILCISKYTLIFAIISAIAGIIAVLLSTIPLFK